MAGFRLERVLRENAGSTTYEATQESLGRRVALTVHDPAGAEAARAAARRQASLHHPGVLSVIETGRDGAHVFVVARLVRMTLADVARPPRRLLGEVEAALEAAHAAGLAHGGLRAETVLVDGDRALLGDFVVPADLEAAQAADRRALAALEARWPRRGRRCRADRDRYARVRAAAGPGAGGPAAGGSARSRWRVTVSLGVVVAPVVAAVAGVLAGGEGASVRDCEGVAPTVDSPPCTLVAASDGVAQAHGVIRAFTVDDASGPLTLQVLRQGAAGTFGEIRRSATVVARGGRQRFPVQVPVRRGDLVGVELGPGAGIRRTDAPARRWSGGLDLVRSPREPDAAAARAPDLHVDLDAGGRAAWPAQRTGAAAAGAPAGTVLVSQTVELGDGTVVRVTLTEVGDTVVLDLLRGGVRRVRAPVPGADPAGHPEILEQGFTRSGLLRLIWRNPDGTIEHAFDAGAGHLRQLY